MMSKEHVGNGRRDYKCERGIEIKEVEEHSVHFPQVRALCPAVLHLLQTRARFAGGWCCAAAASCPIGVVVGHKGVEVAGKGVEVAGKGMCGCGQVISRTSSGQYGAI